MNSNQLEQPILVASGQEASTLATTTDAVCASLSASGSLNSSNPQFDPWTAQNCGLGGAQVDGSWLPPLTHPEGFKVAQLWDGALYSPVEKTVNVGVQWAGDHLGALFDLLRMPIEWMLFLVSNIFSHCPSLLMIALVALLSWKLVGKVFAVGSVISLVLLIMLGVWHETMQTLSLVMTSLIFCILIGLPLGVLAASSEKLNRILRPVLDVMQTTPSFVYLVPIVILLHNGPVSGTIVTIIFALPPLVRMTNLGIRQVRPDLIEAARAYGASPWQMLVKIQIPLALPSVMAGINQSLMLAISMVVVAAMISVPGLGQMVYESIGSLNMGKGVIGGAGIVILAIILDRITQALGEKQKNKREN